jgi:aminoglycoside phosphotransferase family enzyme
LSGDVLLVGQVKGEQMKGHIDPALLEFLRDPASYPHRPRELRELHTHASLLFLVPPLVYKIKKPVNFGFLDFSSLEKRHHYCQREVELNSRLAPGVYLGVVPLTRQADAYAFAGDGPVAEYAVKMTYLEPDGFLNSRIKAENAGVAELERVARTLADFYQKQPSPPEIAEWGGIGKLRISTDENFAQTRRFVGETLSAAAFDSIRGFTEACYQHGAALFDRRVKQGWIRDCHGDLHLDHIHVTGDTLHIYDCIEFNDRFRHLDVASDAAFLAMDLDYHGRPELACFLVRRLAQLLADPEMEGLMDFYKCYRAYVRGKVESLHGIAEIGDASERETAAASARRYFQLSLQYAVTGSRPQAIVIMGRVASGKSTIAAALARELGWPLVSSDPLRKQLAGVPPHHRGDAASRGKLYSAAMTEQTYQTMIRDAAETVRQGHGVILDATFSKRNFRDQLRDTLGDKQLKWIITEADDDTTLERLKQREDRHDVVSDARIGDRAMLDACFDRPDELPPDSLLEFSTVDDPVQSIQRLLPALARLRGAAIGSSS